MSIDKARLSSLITEIDIYFSECSRLSKEIYWKLSPFGLRGQQGILLGEFPFQDLEKLLCEAKYTAECLETVAKILDNYPELVNEIKKGEYKK